MSLFQTSFPLLQLTHTTSHVKRASITIMSRIVNSTDVNCCETDLDQVLVVLTMWFEPGYQLLLHLISCVQGDASSQSWNILHGVPLIYNPAYYHHYQLNQYPNEPHLVMSLLDSHQWLTI